MGEAKPEIFAQARENLRGERIALFHGWFEVFGLGANGPSDQAGQDAFGMFQASSANGFVNGPARTAVFDSGSVSIEAYMADLRFARLRTMIDGLINDQPASHTAAERHIKNRILTLASAAHGFGEGRNVGVVIDSDGSAKDFCRPIGQREIDP